MKNLLIIYNVIFLLVGNVLLSNIHYMHEHYHSHEYETNECQKCINIENGNNYLLDFQEVTFSNNNINQFELQYLRTIEFNIEKKYNPRAPPTF